MVFRAKIFKTNRSQAVRLPKAVAFPDNVTDVEVVVSGESRIITPVHNKITWEEFFNSSPASPDFMSERYDPPLDEREPL